MNPFLAEMYNTHKNIGISEDAEKLAEAQILEEAQLLNELVAGEGYDIESLSDDTIMKVAHAVFGDDSAIVKVAQETSEEAPPKEKKEEKKEEEESVEEKMAQADFLGRQMAHAYVDELATIEKSAGKGEAVKAVGGKVLKAIKGRYAPVAEAAGKWSKPGRSGGQVGRSAKERILGALGEVPKAEAAGAAGLAGLGAGAAMSKKSSVDFLDKLAEERAVAILKEAGYDVETEATDEEKLAAAVEKRAWEMLGEHGFLQDSE